MGSSMTWASMIAAATLATLFVLPAAASAAPITPSFPPEEARVVAVYTTDRASWRSDRGWRVERLPGGGMQVRMSRPRLLDSEGTDHDDAELRWIVMGELGAGGTVRVDEDGKLLSARSLNAVRPRRPVPEGDEVLRLLSDQEAVQRPSGPPPEWQDAVGRWVGLDLRPGTSRTRRLADGELVFEHLGVLEDPPGAIHLSSTQHGNHPECSGVADGAFANALRGGVSEKRAQDVAEELICNGTRTVEVVLEAGTYRPSMVVRQDRVELIRPGRPLKIAQSRVELFFYWGEQGDWGEDEEPEEEVAVVEEPVPAVPVELADEVPVSASWDPWLTAGDDAPEEPEPLRLVWLWRFIGLALLLLPIGGGIYFFKTAPTRRAASLWSPAPLGARSRGAVDAAREGNYRPLAALLARYREGRWEERGYLVRRIAEETDLLPTLVSWWKAEPGSPDANLLLGTAQFVAAREAGAKGLAGGANLERLGSAEKNLRDAAELDPQDPTPWSVLVSVGRHRGAIEGEIRRRLDEALTRDPDGWGARRAFLDAGDSSAPGGAAHLLAVTRQSLRGLAAGDARHALLLTAWCRVWDQGGPAPGELDAIDECERAWAAASAGGRRAGPVGALAKRERARWLSVCGRDGEAAVLDAEAVEELVRMS